MNTEFDFLSDVAVALVKPIAESPRTDDRLLKDIVDRATVAMKEASDAVAAWAAGKRLGSGEAVLEGDFVNEYGLDRWRVTTVAPDADGEFGVRFVGSGERERDVVLPKARLAADGSLVACTGSRMIPVSLLPERTLPGDEFYLEGFASVARLVGRNGPWGLFETRDREGEAQCHVALIASAVAVPSSLFSQPGTPISESTLARLMKLHLAHLQGQVKELSGRPLDGEEVFDTGRFLREAHRGFLSPCDLTKPENFHPEEAAVLAPIFDLLSWPVKTDEWSGRVNIGTSYGCHADVAIEATHLASGGAFEASLELRRSSLKQGSSELAWFDKSQRLALAVAALDAERSRCTKPEAPTVPADVSVGKPKKETKKPKAETAEALTALRKEAADLSPYGKTEEQRRAILAAETIVPTATPDEASAIRDGLSAAFAPDEEAVEPAATTLLAQRVWTAETIQQAEKLIKFVDVLPTGPYSDAFCQMRDFVVTTQASYFVREVAPGWWFACGNGSQRGIASETGYFSGLSLAEDEREPHKLEPRKLVSHLLESPGGHAWLRSFTKSDDCTAALASWVKSLWPAPEMNAIRRLGLILVGLEQQAAIRAQIDEAVTALESPEFGKSDAHRLFNALTSNRCESEPELFAARAARDMIEARFGPFNEPATQPGSEGELFAADEDSDAATDETKEVGDDLGDE